jgi:hypothetical protein
MSEIETFLNTLQQAKPAQVDYEEKVRVAIDVCSEIREKQRVIKEQANAQIHALQESFNSTMHQLAEEAKPLLDSLKPLESQTKAIIISMMNELPDQDEEDKIIIKPDVLIETVNSLPTDEHTSKFIFELLNIVCTNGGEVSQIGLSVYRSSSDPQGILNIDGESGGVDIHFDLDKETEHDNEMVEICLLDDLELDEDEETEEDMEEDIEDETNENEDNREKFQEWANHFPTLNKLVVLGFFTYLANQNK